MNSKDALANFIDAKFSPRERLVMALFYIEGLTFPEIASILGAKTTDILHVFRTCLMLLPTFDATTVMSA